MKTTQLYQTHIDSGAKIGAFAGFEMPLFYPLGVMKEHLHTRAKAGLFDISHMVHIEISGDDVSQLIMRLCPYDAVSQDIGSARYSFFLNAEAGIIDDLIVTRLDKDRYLIVANAGCADKDIEHVRRQSHDFDVQINVLSRSFLALQGPKAAEVLSQYFDVSNLAFMTAYEPQKGWFISRTGYTGEDGFEIALPHDQCVDFANQLIANDDVAWIGLGARDSLRLEAGLPLYGQDLSETISPQDAGLLWSIPKELRQNGTFIGAKALGEKIAEGRSQMRIGLLPQGRPVRAGVDLKNQDGHVIGSITSGGFGPSVGAPVAMGLIAVKAKNEQIFADMRGKFIEMKPTKLPFIEHSYKR